MSLTLGLVGFFVVVPIVHQRLKVFVTLEPDPEIEPVAQRIFTEITWRCANDLDGSDG